MCPGCSSAGGCSASRRFVARNGSVSQNRHSGTPGAASSSGSSVARVSASAAIIVPNTCASTGAAGSADAVTSRLAASSSGPSGDHDCQAAISSGAAAAGQTRWKPVSSGAATVAKASAVTTPKRAPPAPRSAQNRSGSRSASQVTERPSGSVTCAARRASEVSPWRRPRIPSPPPRVRPAMPTSGPQPAGIVTPCGASAS